VGSIQNELNVFYRNLREITFWLTNVIPERIIFVTQGITADCPFQLSPSMQITCRCGWDGNHTSNNFKSSVLHHSGSA